MPTNLDGLIFEQIMPDNSGAPSPLDSDLDGQATQEDEFVSVSNTNSTALDISGWQIWSDSTGGGANDPPQDGLYHTFPPGTVLQPGETLYIINQIDGTLGFAQEASEGGLESGPGAPQTNLLTEGNSGGAAESIAIVKPNGEYIVFNMSPNAPNITGVSGFPGTTLIGTIDGDAVQDDPAAGESYQYDAATDTYVYDTAFVPCFARGSLILTPTGPISIDALRTGDLVTTADHGPQPILWIGATEMSFADGQNADQRPVEFKPGSLGPALPSQTLTVSPQHKLLMINDTGAEVLAPAIGLSERPLTRIKRGARSVTYYHLLLPLHAIIIANDVPTESFYPGDQALNALPVRHRLAVMSHFPQRKALPEKARPFLSVGQTQRARVAMLRPAKAVVSRRKSGETCPTATA